MRRWFGIAIFLLFGLLTAWMFTKDVTFFRTTDVDYRRGTVEQIYAHCGDVVPIMFGDEFADDVPQYLHPQCRKAARSHLGWIVILGGAAIASLVAAIAMGGSSRHRDIHSVLRRLPTPEEIAAQKLPD